jgi:hypothetical protein
MRAIDECGNLDYGGSSDVGGIDGDSYDAVMQAALTNTAAGVIMLQELAYNYSLVVPENVTVIECLNGLTRVFINVADTQGSPYTVSVDTVNTNYYLAQDSADRFISSWTSTNPTVPISNAVSVMTTGEIYLKSATYLIQRLTSDKTSITNADKFPLVVSSGKNIKFVGEEGTVLKAASGENVGLLYFTSGSTGTVENIELDGNYIGQTFNGLPYAPYYQDLYCVYSYSPITITNVWCHDAVTDNIALTVGGTSFLTNVNSTHAQFDAMILGSATSPLKAVITNYRSDGYIEVAGNDKNITLLLTNYVGYTTATTIQPMLSITAGSPTVILNNFDLENGRIQSDSTGNPEVHFLNGKLNNGSITLNRCYGSIIGVNQTGNLGVNGLTLFGCSLLAVSACSFTGNYGGITLSNDTNNTPCTDNTFTNIITRGNANWAYKESDSTQNYNGLSFFNARLDGWMILTKGANTHVSQSWNLTSWVI